MNLRQSVRYPSAIRIQLLPAGHSPMEAQILNLSRGGTLLALSQADIDFLAQAKDQPLPMKLFLPTGLAQGHAAISWILLGKQQMGLRFHGWDDAASVKNLEAFVANGFL